jgi:putative transposase
MSHAHVCVRVHFVFSTKDRRPTIPKDLLTNLWGYIGATANNLGLTTIAVGGMPDHVHALIGLSPTIPVATAVQKLKANSSRWLAQETRKPFTWQEGYSAFSVSRSLIDTTARYIRNQAEHHRKRSPDEEFAMLLKLHGLKEE